MSVKALHKLGHQPMEEAIRCWRAAAIQRHVELLFLGSWLGCVLGLGTGQESRSDFARQPQRGAKRPEGSCSSCDGSNVIEV